VFKRAPPGFQPVADQPEIFFRGREFIEFIYDHPVAVKDDGILEIGINGTKVYVTFRI
jgi:hypothetical protein